jgi:hypothetical protein
METGGDSSVGSGLDQGLMDTLTQPVSPTSGDTSGSGPSSGSTTPASQGQYTFAGRKYPNQAAAEKSFTSQQSSYSKAQETLKRYEETLKDPRLLEVAAKDPAIAQALMKLGIDPTKAMPQQPGQAPQQGQMPPEMQAAYQDMMLNNHMNKLDREMTQFQRGLKRDLSDQEHDTCMDLIAERPWLTIKEAYTLAFADRDHAQALKRMESQRGGAQRNGRMKPPPGFIPGTTVDTKKATVDMNEEEYREALREDIRGMDL